MHDKIVLGIAGYLHVVSQDPWDSMPDGTTLGILGYLVSRDPWDSMPDGTTWNYPGILSIYGSMGLHAW